MLIDKHEVDNILNRIPGLTIKMSPDNSSTIRLAKSVPTAAFTQLITRPMPPIRASSVSSCPSRGASRKTAASMTDNGGSGEADVSTLASKAVSASSSASMALANAETEAGLNRMLGRLGHYRQQPNHDG